jgi:hypothetical protein
MSFSMATEGRPKEDIGAQEQPPPYHRDCRSDLQPVRDHQAWSIERVNALLNRLELPRDANEPLIEDLLERVENSARESHLRYRLLTARILEAALLCAGHYVDHCEFTAAGDLLVNPRQILIHIRGCRHPVIKRRHGRISEQLAAYCGTQPFPVWFRHNAILEISKPALVPCLLQRLEQFHCFCPAYLDSIHRRMDKAADTIGFLSAWGVTGWEDLHRRIQWAASRERDFITANLCSFDTRDFYGLGRDIDRMAQLGGARSTYLKA